MLEQVHLHQKVQVLTTLSLGLLLSRVRRWTSRKVSFIKDSLGRAEYNIPLCVVNKSIAIILIPNKYHEFRVQYKFACAVTPLENFLWKCSMGYTLYPWISLLEPTLETSYKPQT